MSFHSEYEYDQLYHIYELADMNYYFLRLFKKVWKKRWTEIPMYVLWVKM